MDKTRHQNSNLALVSKGVLTHTNMQHTGVYTQAITEPVQAALQEHADFVLRGGHSTPKPSPVLQLPPPIQLEAMRHDSGRHEE
jgi:hypothetical protein